MIKGGVITFFIHKLKVIYIESVKKYMSVMLTYTFICGVGIVLGIYLPLKLGNVMDAAIEKDYTGVIRLLVQIFLLFLASSILNNIKSLTSLTITVRMSEEIKNKIVSKVMIMPMKNIDSLENGQIVSKLEKKVIWSTNQAVFIV
ncbi:MAG: hypothetical protein K2L86_14325 [Lachnospiraceae bacterium]|nr:hypothetical protein [Lachnospiraceae bacterium]